MKTTTRNVLVGLMTGGAMLMAGSVTIPNTFHANTTAKASEVNANFTAVKTAVNGNVQDITDNANDIATNAHDIASNKSDIASNASDMVKEIDVGHGLTVTRTDGNVTIKKASGYVAVHGSAFASIWPFGDYCDLITDYRPATMYGTLFSSNSTHGDCEAYAPVDIPNGARITGLTCRVKHNVADDLHVRLYMQNREYTFAPPPPTIGDIQKTVLVDASLDAGDQSASTQEIGGTYTPPHFLILNPTYRSYFIQWDPPQTSTANTNEAIFDCKVDYTY